MQVSSEVAHHVLDPYIAETFSAECREPGNMIERCLKSIYQPTYVALSASMSITQLQVSVTSKNWFHSRNEGHNQ